MVGFQGGGGERRDLLEEERSSWAGQAMLYPVVVVRRVILASQVFQENDKRKSVNRTCARRQTDWPSPASIYDFR